MTTDSPAAGLTEELRPCICADPENCRAPIPGRLCKAQSCRRSPAQEGRADVEALIEDAILRYFGSPVVADRLHVRKALLQQIMRELVSRAISLLQSSEGAGAHQEVRGPAGGGERKRKVGDKCACCTSKLSHRGYDLQCNNCGWVAPRTQSRQVVNPPADEAEAGNLANTAPRQSEHDDARRGETGMSSCPEARPVIATAQQSVPLTPALRNAMKSGAVASRIVAENWKKASNPTRAAECEAQADLLDRAAQGEGG